MTTRHGDESGNTPKALRQATKRKVKEPQKRNNSTHLLDEPERTVGRHERLAQAVAVGAHHGHALPDDLVALADHLGDLVLEAVGARLVFGRRGLGRLQQREQLLAALAVVGRLGRVR